MFDDRGAFRLSLLRYQLRDKEALNAKAPKPHVG
jgi:hypothetical protein